MTQGEEKAKRRWGRGRKHISVGPNWIMIFLIGEKLLWQATHKETALLTKGKCFGWAVANISISFLQKSFFSYFSIFNVECLEYVSLFRKLRRGLGLIPRVS